MRRFLRQLASPRARLRALWDLARRERSSPHQTALSIAIGTFAAFTPFIGLHMWIALGLATLLRLNRLWAFLASRVSIAPVFATVAFAEIEAAHRLRTGTWLPLAPTDVLGHARELMLDWLLGTPLVGGALAACAGGITYVVARRVATTRAAALTHTPGELPPPSSESPPSEPQARSG
jgi:uncharacterized protein (DUF2062 family)